jgi:hypothetical protein
MSATKNATSYALSLCVAAACVAFAPSVYADEPMPPRREWTALGAGAAIPLQSGGVTGLALSQELGRHWIGASGDDGFATGLLLGEELRFPSGGTITSLLIQFRALWDIKVPVGANALTFGPAFAGGVDLSFYPAGLGTVSVSSVRRDATGLAGPPMKRVVGQARSGER